jgi:murein DD-endopeptidase MepM/ murein hydrolase activator NlpD
MFIRIIIVITTSLGAGFGYTFISPSEAIKTEAVESTPFVNKSLSDRPPIVIPNTMVWPVPESEITSHFGPRDLLGLGFHYGLDFGGPYNLPIPAVVGGTVIFAGWNYGYEVRIQDGQYTYLYAHLNQIDAVVGQTVSMGQQIGLMGSTGFSTGPHLHLEVWDNGVPIDPYPILKDRAEVKYIPR